MSDLTARIMEVVAKLKGEGAPAPAAPAPPSAPGPDPASTGPHPPVRLPAGQRLLARMIVGEPLCDLPCCLPPLEDGS